MLLLMSMCYLSFLRGDIIIEQYEMMKWKYFNEVTIVNGKRQKASHVPESRGGSGEHADGEREQGGAQSEGAIAGGVFEGVR